MNIEKKQINNLSADKSKEKVSRNSNIELLRIFLSTCVVVIHTIARTWYMPFLGASVNCFAIISGYFLVKKRWSLKIFKISSYYVVFAFDRNNNWAYIE